MTRIAFIDGDSLYLNSLKAAIHLQPTMICAVAAGSIHEFWGQLPDRAALDLIFIELDLPDSSGLDALPLLRRRFPNAELVILTKHEDENWLLQSFLKGATGYLLKDFPVMKLPVLVCTMNEGGALISPKMARYMIRYFQPQQKPKSQLNTKELQLLRLFSQGKSYKAGAQLLGLTIDGVKYHVKKIYAKLQVNNKLDAIRAVKDEL